MQFKHSEIDLARPSVMGIVNVTPDSFSDGGRFVHLDAALRQVEQMLKDGATFIRRISKGNKEQRYNLVCLNPAWNGNPEPVFFNIEIEAAAPIIWHRRLDDS